MEVVKLEHDISSIKRLNADGDPSLKYIQDNPRTHVPAKVEVKFEGQWASFRHTSLLNVVRASLLDGMPGYGLEIDHRFCEHSYEDTAIDGRSWDIELRLGNLPLSIDVNDSYLDREYTVDFTYQPKNINAPRRMPVFSGQFEGTGELPFSNTHCLIELNRGQTYRAKVKVVKGRGVDHAKFSNVCRAVLAPLDIEQYDMDALNAEMIEIVDQVNSYDDVDDIPNDLLARKKEIQRIMKSSGYKVDALQATPFEFLLKFYIAAVPVKMKINKLIGHVSKLIQRGVDDLIDRVNVLSITDDGYLANSDETSIMAEALMCVANNEMRREFSRVSYDTSNGLVMRFEGEQLEDSFESLKDRMVQLLTEVKDYIATVGSVKGGADYQGDTVGGSSFKRCYFVSLDEGVPLADKIVCSRTLDHALAMSVGTDEEVETESIIGMDGEEKIFRELQEGAFAYLLSNQYKVYVHVYSGGGFRSIGPEEVESVGGAERDEVIELSGVEIREVLEDAGWRIVEME